MLSSIRRYFETHINPSSSDTQPERAVQLATASLLIEVSRADFQIDEDERNAINKAVQDIFALTQEEAESLTSLAESEINDSTCLYEFTREVNENFDYQQKLQIVENMWKVAFADFHKDKYEEHIIRRVCDLIYVAPQDFVRLREVHASR